MMIIVGGKAYPDPSVRQPKHTMTYTEIVNHPLFRKANRLVHQTEDLLMEMDMTKEEARGWIRAWTSGAGDGSY